MTVRSKKILFYLYSLGAGGAERVVALLASGFAARGHEVTLALQDDADENRPFVSDAVKIARLPRGHGAAVRQLADLLRQEKPDISLSALGLCNLKHTLAATLAGRRHRAILSVHGHIDAEPQPTSRLANRLMIATTRVTARTVCVSDWMRAHVVNDLHGSAARTVTIYNPAPIEQAIPAADAAALAARPPVILALGRLAPAKDFATLLRAFAAMRRPEARLVIIGEGPERTGLEALAQTLGIADRIAMPGYVAEPWPWFRTARVCAVSSLTESFSNVAVEALAHGLPVVSTDCGGPREILTRPEEGILVPVGDVTAMAAALAASLDEPGDPALRIARARDFSLAVALDAYSALFDRVTDNR